MYATDRQTDGRTKATFIDPSLRWGTFVPNLGTLGLWVLNYSLCTRRTDRQTDGRTKATLYDIMPPSLRAGAYHKVNFYGTIVGDIDKSTSWITVIK